MSKLRRDLRLAMAGACFGLFSVSMFLLAARVSAYHDYMSSIPVDGYSRRCEGVEDLWWIPVVAWHVVLSVAGSLLVHRYLTSRVSTFLRWQAIGFVVLLEWLLSVFTAVGIDCLVRESTWPIEQAFSMFKLLPVAQFVAAVFASNVLYGTAVQAAAAETLSAQVNESEA